MHKALPFKGRELFAPVPSRVVLVAVVAGIRGHAVAEPRRARNPVGRKISDK
jgi:hypothetical protein